MRVIQSGEMVLSVGGLCARVDGWYSGPEGFRYQIGSTFYRRDELFVAGDQVIDGDDDAGVITKIQPLTVQYDEYEYEWRTAANAELRHADGVEPEGPDSGSEDLASWWDRTSAEDRDACLAKTAEYGAGDLAIIGGLLADFGVTAAIGREAEMGCWFYLIGKVARANSAYERGEAPSDDTINDIETYSRMIRRIRQNGEWG